MIRMTRGISCRTIYPGEAKCLVVQPIFTGEDLANFHGQLHAASIPARSANADNWAFLGATGLLEVNFTYLFIPYHVMCTYTVNPGEQPLPPETSDDWDTLCRRLLLEFGTDGNEFYGGNPDNKAVYDVNAQTWFKVRHHQGTQYGRQTYADTNPKDGSVQQSPESTAQVNPDPAQLADTNTMSGDQPGTQATDEPLINGTMGPMGVLRMWNNEVFLSPSATAGVNREIPSTLTAFFDLFSSGWGYMDITHAYSNAVSVSGGSGSKPGACCLVAHRYDVPDESSPDFSLNWSLGQTTPAQDGQEYAGMTLTQHQEKLRALAALFGADVERVKADLKLDNSFRGDYLRSLMFGGDLMLERPETWATNIFGSSGVFGDTQNKTWLRPNGMMIGCKWSQSTLTPYDMHFNG